ncbi:MAG: ribosome-associated translation inhibitor RaiA [Xylanivirga thermophila]|jgi:putative sigma-54 modulation protein|uniref:ribosome hibernation-promoting factor, HPF/YfiA family n=1 Tax=Xylanivirga thermophila TaxID=2496273 RepID=UPI0039F4DB99
MRIILSGKNIEITDALRDQVYKKVGKLERYFDEDTEVYVTMSVEKNRHIMEVTIPFNGIVIRAEDSTDDMYTTIDKVLDKLEKQIHKHRTKLSKKIRSGAFKYEKPVFSEAFEPEEVDMPKLVKTKRFAVKPMHVEEAILQMDLLGHAFFVFINAESDEVNVVYKRKDGNYGLIEPEYL